MSRTKKPTMQVVTTTHDAILNEISKSLKNLETNHKVYEELIEAKAVHSVEIKHINEGIEKINHAMEKILDEVKKFDTRVSQLESITTDIKVTKGERRHANFLEVVREYSHMLAFIVAAAAFVLAYFFGIKTPVE